MWLYERKMMVQTSQKSNPIPYEGAKIVTRENRLADRPRLLTPRVLPS